MSLPSVFSKTLLLAKLLPRQPLELLDRVRAVMEVQYERHFLGTPRYSPDSWESVVDRLSSLLGLSLSEYLSEPALIEIEAEISRGASSRPSDAPFESVHDADLSLARICYSLCRATRPRIALETGVAYGVTSSFILGALQQNGGGILHSIDLPPLGRDADRFVGSLIPERLRRRWVLHRGISRRVLPLLLPRLGTVDFFLHDSLHTYRNMTLEFNALAPYLASPSVVLADDVDCSAAFHEWVIQAKPAFSAIIREEAKGNLLGISLLADGSDSVDRGPASHQFPTDRGDASP